ncbi:hypothetical protein HBI56_047150 [Parastagonospora nodorum]|uniref:Rhodopsin domain-containing protein n=2 Tax=Phaeosphaeria nodorum (strain SN15 / ATCC MYA-4574 / FGSC 10173) TaxID=321614 RepID=A0A7U2ERP3_PHANO|nr:hypothetical protein SNOG_02042 [Parastagonospora nodorum SN15]KAH3916545.1 hypothetical protein HBH56_060060 [Parastagonospora nodorum]EAT90254.1 hypothetical protein SNOG_02042 [Parastagonospora nodorum SN15]KAH3931147.1 hypothetical protein HBH54_103990 [Parastagonospora nodorum]KAH3953992.1 hypothetical protein HBH53_018670 [Parastagonospora nodorum]KAH3965341.1 hypothetical protein HBH51_152740 [Parastagonospora nodorum]
MAAGSPSPEFLAETNDPGLDQRVSIAFIVIDTFFLAVFYVSRYYNPKAVGLPMLVCNTLCYVLCLGSAVTGILMTQIGGVGYHVAAVPVTTFQTWLKLSKVLEFTYTPAVMFAKLAALFLYYQVFEVTSYRRAIIGIGVIIILQGVISFILAFSICRPFRYFWTQAVDPGDGTCGDVMLFYKSYSIPSLVTDVMMLILPWPLLIKLRMPLSEKIGLFLTFLAASMGIITCALRFSVFFTTPLFSDATWYASGGPMIYALVEPSIYMIASILPTTRHLYRRIHRRARELRSSGHDSEPKHSNPGAQLERMEPGDADERGHAQHVDPRQTQTTTTSSQEELTSGGWQQKRQAWKQRRPEKKVDKIEKKEKPAKSGGFKGHDVSTMDSSGS